MYFDSIHKAFCHLLYDRNRKFLGIESRLPAVGERLVVMHGFFLSGMGTVKAVNENSPDEKVIISIEGNETVFDVSYTFTNRECWECVKGESRIDSGAIFGIYVGDDDEMIDPAKFKLLTPPTAEGMRYYANDLRE